MLCLQSSKIFPQCAEQLLRLSLRNAVALAVIHWISQDPAWIVWESHPAANCWEGKGGGNQHEKHTKYKHYTGFRVPQVILWEL